MKKCIFAALLFLCGMAAAGCGGKESQETQGAESVYQSETPDPSALEPSAQTEDGGTDAEQSTDTESADTVPGDSVHTGGNIRDADPSGEAGTSPATVAAYLSRAEEFWKNGEEDPDEGGLFFPMLAKIRENDGQGCTVDIAADDLGETGKFTLTVSSDLSDEPYVLEGGKEQDSIVFGDYYRLGDTLFLGVGVNGGNKIASPYALDLKTNTLTECKKEVETVESLCSDWLQAGSEDAGLRICYCSPAAYVEDCIIYRAHISDASDHPAEAAAYAAFDASGSLRAFLLLEQETP